MAMRTREQQKAVFAKMFGNIMGHMKGAVKIKEPENSRFAFSPTVPEILADGRSTDIYGRPNGTIGIGPGMGIAGDTQYAFSISPKKSVSEVNK